MSTRKGRKKSKAAQATAEKRRARAASKPANAPRPKALQPAEAETPEVVEFTGGGGMMTRMRGGFQDVVGQGEPARKAGAGTKIIWALVAIAAAVAAYARFG